LRSVAVEIIHDVVFLELAPVQLGNFLGNAAGSELLVSKVGIA
jgi:hypothetical protein